MKKSIFTEDINSMFYKSYINKIKENIDEKSFINLDNKINKIASYCKGKKEKLLIIGKIQSGKTNLFLGLISKLLDKKTNVVFIMAGVDQDIYSQNLERIRDTFDRNIINNNIEIIEEKSKNKEATIEKAILENKKIIICCLKNYLNINKWENILNNIKNSTINPIIIDDEGDQYSFKDIKKEELSKTYKSIISILSMFGENYTFVSVTATPYAHILLDNSDIMKSDYAFVSNTNINYIGVNFFNESICDNRDDITQIIPDQEIDDFFSDMNELGETFNEALVIFLFNGALFYQFFDKLPEMLINPDIKKIYHDQIKKI